jgi:hypothetical protein
MTDFIVMTVRDASGERYSENVNSVNASDRDWCHCAIITKTSDLVVRFKWPPSSGTSSLPPKLLIGMPVIITRLTRIVRRKATYESFNESCPMTGHAPTQAVAVIGERYRVTRQRPVQVCANPTALLG